MSDDYIDPTQLLSTTLFEKEWGVALPSSVVEIFDALLSDGSHVRPAIDARLRRSNAYLDGLESCAWEENEPWPGRGTPRLNEMNREASFGAQKFDLALARTRTLGNLLDLLVTYEVVTLDARGEYSMNPLAPHALEAP